MSRSDQGLSRVSNVKGGSVCNHDNLLAAYAFTTTIDVRFRDLDALVHVNLAASKP
jgi:hypothetical protein